MIMHVFVRRDLAPSYRMVQGAHALAEFALENPKGFSEWKNSTIVFLGVDGIDGLERIIFEKADKFPTVKFCEPDLKGELTSLTCYAPRGTFSKYKLA